MFSSSINYNGFSYFTSCFSALQTQGFKVKISTERLQFIKTKFKNPSAQLHVIIGFQGTPANFLQSFANIHRGK